MKRKWLVILALGVFLLSVAPAQPLASAKSQNFTTTLNIVGINETVIGTNVFPVPNGPKDPLKDGTDVIRWLIRGRQVWGILGPGDITGTIGFVMDGNLDTTQTGNLHGNFTIDTGPIDFSRFPPQGDGSDLITGNAEIKLVAGAPIFERPAETPGYAYFIAPVNATGRMVMQRGTDSLAGFHAEAQFSGAIMKAELLVNLQTGEGHVVGFLPAPVTITGKQT